MKTKKQDFIVDDLISKIYQHNFWNDKLPTQRDLAFAYQVSRFTIQKALKKLQSIGLIEPIQGDGIYIRTKALGNPLVYNSLIDVPYEDMQSKMLYLKKIIPDSSIAHIFSLKEDEPVWEFRRIRIVHYEISQVETGYMPYGLFPDLNQTNIEDSIQNYVLQKKYKISHFMTNYHASSLPPEHAELMCCHKGTPSMFITSRGLLKDGRIFIFSQIHAIHYECTYIIPFNKDVYLSRRKRVSSKNTKILQKKGTPKA